MVVDVCTFNGEYDLFDIRYNILKDYVDEFVVIEAPTTFSGKKKPLYFEKIKDKYAKVKYFVIKEDYSNEEWIQALESPNTKGAYHWKWEFLQKERIKQALTHLKDDDIVFIGDCDEIWNPNELMPWCKDINWEIMQKLKLKVYSYWLNNQSNEEFWGTIMGNYETIKNNCLNHLRSLNNYKTPDYNGWHFTSLKDGLRRKLQDSYTQESYATEAVMSNLDKNIAENKDFLGRDFKYWVDESDWPQYLKDNRVLYKHLCK